MLVFSCCGAAPTWVAYVGCVTALLEAGEIIAPEFPPPQGARALPTERLPLDGLAVEFWHGGQWFKCTIATVEAGSAAEPGHGEA